jgi:hypothetical protein
MLRIHSELIHHVSKRLMTSNDLRYLTVSIQLRSLPIVNKRSILGSQGQRSISNDLNIVNSLTTVKLYRMITYIEYINYMP